MLGVGCWGLGVGGFQSFVGVDEAFLHAALVFGIVNEFLAHTVLHERRNEDGNERGWNTNEQDVFQFDAFSTQQVGADDGCRGCRHRTARDTQGCCDGGNGHGAFGADLAFGGYLGNNGQQRIAGMSRACYETEE